MLCLPVALSCVALSYHQAAGGLPAGTYSLSYRFMPSGTAHRTASGRLGIVSVPVVADGQTWTTATLAPQVDIAALWPGPDSCDFALYELTLSAVSTGDKASGSFDYLRFDRRRDGRALFAQQASMMTAYAEQYPAVTQQQGLEVSFGLPHIQWFGNAAPTGYDGTMKEYPAWVEQEGIPAIHAAGGLACWNHPFGTSWTAKVKPAATQNTLLQQATLTVDTSASSFLRTQVVDSAGKVQGLSNPVWLLGSPPPNGIPAPRQA